MYKLSLIKEYNDEVQTVHLQKLLVSNMNLNTSLAVSKIKTCKLLYLNYKFEFVPIL